MRMKISTAVNSSLLSIKQGFNSDLFLKLNPPFPPVKLNEFGGCQAGDRVSLTLNFILFKQKWISDIIENGESKRDWHFVDQGTTLPFFLKHWKHRHVVKDENDKRIIIDDIDFSTGSILGNLIMYPILYLQFLYRKPIYKSVFS